MSMPMYIYSCKGLELLELQRVSRGARRAPAETYRAPPPPSRSPFRPWYCTAVLQLKPLFPQGWAPEEVLPLGISGQRITMWSTSSLPPFLVAYISSCGQVRVYRHPFTGESQFSTRLASWYCSWALFRRLTGTWSHTSLPPCMCSATCLPP